MVKAAKRLTANSSAVRKRSACCLDSSICSSNSRTRRIVALLLGKVAEAWIHFSVLVRLALNGKFEAIGRIEFTLENNRSMCPKACWSSWAAVASNILAVSSPPYRRHTSAKSLYLICAIDSPAKAASRFWKKTKRKTQDNKHNTKPRNGADVRPKDIVAG